MTLPAKPSHRARVIVVEDSSVFREMQALLLRQAGFGVWSFETPADALREATQQQFELALVDYELPGMNGRQFMQALRELQPHIPVIFVSGSLTLQLVSELTHEGAAGIFRKPTNPRVLLEKIHETLNHAAHESELRASTNLASGLSTAPFGGPEPAADRLAYEPHYVYGTSEAFRALTHRLWRVRDFRSVLLLHGEAGSPFELFARELIGISTFRAGPTMVCEVGEFEPRRLSEILAPSLLASHAGTLIIHGVDDFTAGQQQMLNELILMRGMFQPFARHFRVVLTATSRLAERVETGHFDEALYYKICGLSVGLPSLGEMRGDIAVNTVRLLEHYQTTSDASAPVALAPEAAAWLEAQPWPGNYAQLAHTLFLALRHATGKELALEALVSAARDYEADRLTRVPGGSNHPLRPSPSVETAADCLDSSSPMVRVHPAHLPADAPASHPF